MGRAAAVGDLTIKVQPIWEKCFKKWKAEDLLEVLNRFGGSSTFVNNYQQLFSHPQMEALDMVREADHAKLGEIKFLGPPWKLRGVATVEPQPYSIMR